mmetsp:Transcript_4857/g.10371  ORF Transcript_4857/g.10371 Transcript_4857/m.10371 type:complete len:174 (-) Transcript_4857:59-580(-)
MGQVGSLPGSTATQLEAVDGGVGGGSIACDDAVVNGGSDGGCGGGEDVEVRSWRTLDGFAEDELTWDMRTQVNTRKNRSSVRTQVMLLAKELERRLALRLDAGEPLEHVLLGIPPEVRALLQLQDHLPRNPHHQHHLDHLNDYHRRSSLHSIESDSSSFSSPSRTRVVRFKLD